MPEMTTLHVKIPAAMKKKMEKIITDKDYHSFSEFSREAIRTLIDKHAN